MPVQEGAAVAGLLLDLYSALEEFGYWEPSGLLLSSAVRHQPRSGTAAAAGKWPRMNGAGGVGGRPRGVPGADGRGGGFFRL